MMRVIRSPITGQMRRAGSARFVAKMIKEQVGDKRKAEIFRFRHCYTGQMSQSRGHGRRFAVNQIFNIRLSAARSSDERKKFEDILAYLRLIANPSDISAWKESLMFQGGESGRFLLKK